MKRILLSLPVAAVALGATVAHAEVTGDQMKALETRVAQLEAERSAPEPAADTASSGKLTINGFLSAGFGRADIDGFNYDNGLYNQWSSADSLVGLRIDAKVNDKINAVTQLVARGMNDFTVDADWAYIGYRPAANDELRVGRQRFPFFMMSEYLGVGDAYPWAKPPSEVYITAMPAAYDGISWHHQIDAGAWSHNFQVFWGNVNFLVDGATFSMQDGWGAGWTSNVGNWQFSATYSHGEATFSNPLFDALASYGLIEPEVRKTGQYGGLGVQYDNGKLLLMGEATEIAIQGFFPDTTQQYVTLGYHFGKVMPHITYAATQTLDHDQRPDIPAAALSALCPASDPNPNASLCMAIVPNTVSAPPPTTFGIPLPSNTMSRLLDHPQDSLTLGVRYDFLPHADLKLDWTHVLDTHGLNGYFLRQDGNVLTGALPGNDINVYRVVVDVTF